jgi:hypothetical protein
MSPARKIILALGRYDSFFVKHYTKAETNDFELMRALTIQKQTAPLWKRFKFAGMRDWFINSGGF